MRMKGNEMLRRSRSALSNAQGVHQVSSLTLTQKKKQQQKHNILSFIKKHLVYNDSLRMKIVKYCLFFLLL